MSKSNVSSERKKFRLGENFPKLGLSFQKTGEFFRLTVIRFLFHQIDFA